ncbi:transposase [Streptomyces pharetrae]|uniref:transposase n=1 Tax=Streptomyces pharetrae TaxID=291370 RepID=UPI00335BE156
MVFVDHQVPQDSESHGRIPSAARVEVARSADTPGGHWAAALEDRQVINGMVYKIRTGVSWRDLQEGHDPWKTVNTRFRRYALGACSPALCSRSKPKPMLLETSTGSCRSTPPSSALTSTPPPPAGKGGGIGRTNRTITPSADPEVD